MNETGSTTKICPWCKGSGKLIKLVWEKNSPNKIVYVKQFQTMCSVCIGLGTIQLANNGPDGGRRLLDRPKQ